MARAVQQQAASFSSSSSSSRRGAAPSESSPEAILEGIADHVARSLESQAASFAPPPPPLLRRVLADALALILDRLATGEAMDDVHVNVQLAPPLPPPLAPPLSPPATPIPFTSTFARGSAAASAAAGNFSSSSSSSSLAAFPPLRSPSSALLSGPSSSLVGTEGENVTSVSYQRIHMDPSAGTDPLSGLYLGSFGPHGPELLRLDRTLVDGEEVVQATKLTGDANVPAGSISFRAKVGRKHRLAVRDVYPDELGITARYQGEGRVAQKGFTQPRWVEGELLVFTTKGNPVTAGAELGFVWSVPGEKRFLILLNRIDLTKTTGGEK